MEQKSKPKKIPKNKAIRKSSAMRASIMVKQMENMGLAEYCALMQNKRRLLYTNFLGGIARGLGVAVGFSILGAILIAIIQRIAVDKLPVFGDFLADVIRMVQRRL